MGSAGYHHRHSNRISRLDRRSINIGDNRHWHHLEHGLDGAVRHPVQHCSRWYADHSVRDWKRIRNSHPLAILFSFRKNHASKSYHRHPGQSGTDRSCSWFDHSGQYAVLRFDGYPTDPGFWIFYRIRNFGNLGTVINLYSGGGRLDWVVSQTK